MISDLPRDLEWEILSRVPSKSLARLQTTCKRWYDLFKDPNFVKKNLNKAVKEVLLLDFEVYSVTINLHGINDIVDPSMEITGKLSRLNDSKDLEIREMFHCDGLILCTMKEKTNENISHVVWNPCTGETRMIKPTNRYRKDCVYFLGYGNNKSSCHNYKILKFRCTNRRVVKIEIYELISETWRVLDDFNYKRFIDFFSGVSLKGNAYWITSDEDNLLSFDFTTERFVSFPLPYQSDNSSGRINGLSVIGEEQLAVLYQSIGRLSPESEIEVWLTNKIDEAKEVSWSKFVVDFHKCLLPYYSLTMTFLVDEENKVVVCCTQDIKREGCTRTLSSVYIVGEGFHKQVYKEIEKRSLLRARILSYVPSLVRIPKAKDLDKREC